MTSNSYAFCYKQYIIFYLVLSHPSCGVMPFVCISLMMYQEDDCLPIYTNVFDEFHCISWISCVWLSYANERKKHKLLDFESFLALYLDSSVKK